MTLPPEYLRERFEMIVKYENPPNRDDLLVLIKKIFAQNGYDTPEKREEWYRNQRPVTLIGFRTAEIPKECSGDSEGS